MILLLSCSTAGQCPSVRNYCCFTLARVCGIHLGSRAPHHRSNSVPRRSRGFSSRPGTQHVSARRADRTGGWAGEGDGAAALPLRACAVHLRPDLLRAGVPSNPKPQTPNPQPQTLNTQRQVTSQKKRRSCLRVCTRNQNSEYKTRIGKDRELCFTSPHTLKHGLVFKAHTLLYHSTLGSRVMKKRKKKRHETKALRC